MGCDISSLLQIPVVAKLCLLFHYPRFFRHENEMVRSGNTECTQVSGAAGNSQNGGRGLQTAGANYVAKRSIGIQLSVQNTPK